MKKIFIDLDGGKKLDLGSLDTFVSKKFRLRTVDKNQFQARINLGLMDDGSAYLLGSTYLEKLKSSENGFSYLDCVLKKENRRLFLVIGNGGRTVCREDFSLLPRKILFRYIFWSAAGLILAAGLVLFLLSFDFGGIGGSDLFRSAQAPSREVSRDSGKTEAPVTQPDSTDKTEVFANASTETTRSVAVRDPSAEEESAADTENGWEQSGMAREEKNEKKENEGFNNVSQDGTEEGTSQTVPAQPDFSLLDKEDLVLYFTPNSAALSSVTLESLENVLSFLLDYPSLHVMITGHCAIAGTEAGRREISVSRAANVEEWLRRGGWNPEYPPQVKGEAGNFPLTRDPDNQEINRRVEIIISE